MPATEAAKSRHCAIYMRTPSTTSPFAKKERKASAMDDTTKALAQRSYRLFAFIQKISRSRCCLYGFSVRCDSFRNLGILLVFGNELVGQQQRL